MTNGRRVLVFGYGACGRGIAAAFRSAYAAVSVVETDPVARLEAFLDGFAVPEREDALRQADVVITATGAVGVVAGADLGLLKDDAVLCNAGHFPTEIAAGELTGSPDAAGVETTGEGIATIRLSDGRRVHLLAGGHMVNLAGPRPLGNSIESMDLGFALQARCLEAIATGSVDGGNQVIAVPRFIDEMVAQAFLDAYGASARPRPHEAG
jgi:adenosylhomocysteinase